MNEEKKEENTERRGDGDEGNRTPRRSGEDQPRASFNGKLMGVCRDQRPVGQGHQGGIQEALDESHGGILPERERVDLLKEEPYLGYLTKAKDGFWIGMHSGFPCTSFTRLRWRRAEGYPGPVRSKAHIRSARIAET